jgi:hypothetical protein
MSKCYWKALSDLISIGVEWADYWTLLTLKCKCKLEIGKLSKSMSELKVRLTLQLGYDNSYKYNSVYNGENQLEFKILLLGVVW